MGRESHEGVTSGGTAEAASVRDNRALSRFEIHVGHQLAGYAEYRDLSHGRAFVHTVVYPRYEGFGRASQLIDFALDEARLAQRKVIPLCPFVLRFVMRHPSYVDLVADTTQFRLDGTS